MTGGAGVVLEELVALELLGGEGCGIAFEVAVEGIVGGSVK